MELQVDCYAGYRGEQTPRRFVLGGQTFEIAEVLDAWLAPDRRYFKVRTDHGDVYILRHDTEEHRWELAVFQRSGQVADSISTTSAKWSDA